MTEPDDLGRPGVERPGLVEHPVEIEAGDPEVVGEHDAEPRDRAEDRVGRTRAEALIGRDRRGEGPPGRGIGARGAPAGGGDAIGYLGRLLRRVRPWLGPPEDPRTLLAAR